MKSRVCIIYIIRSLLLCENRIRNCTPLKLEGAGNLIHGRETLSFTKKNLLRQKSVSPTEVALKVCCI
jgi:hypothetical protein